MRLAELREEQYALANWYALQPFFCRLSPEYIWQTVRDDTLHQLEWELSLPASQEYQYRTYFTFPPQEQIVSTHEQFKDQGLFMSEILEMVGYRAAESLSTLAGLLRLEPKGDSRSLFEEAFHTLWQQFSRYSYSRGYDTSSVRRSLALTLASNNVFALLDDKSWPNHLLDYFLTGSHDWTGQPLKQICPDVIRALGGPSDTFNADDAFLAGLLDLDGSDFTPQKLTEWWHWEQGLLGNDLSLPALLWSAQRRGISGPMSDFYDYPYHLLEVRCRSLENTDMAQVSDPFTRIVVHFVLSLQLRTSIVRAIGVSKPFRQAQAAELCDADLYGVKMALGQLIKVGLVDFDLDSPLPWDSEEREYICNTGADGICR